MPFLPLHDTSSTRYKQTTHSTIRFTSAGLPSLHNAYPSTNRLHILGKKNSHCSSSSALEVIMRKKPFHYCSVSSIQMWSLSQSWITRRMCTQFATHEEHGRIPTLLSHVIKLPPKGWYLAFVILFQWRIWNEFSSF